MIYLFCILGYAFAMFATSYAVMTAFILLEGEVTKDREFDNQCIAMWCGILWPIVWIFAAMCAAAAALIALISGMPLLGVYISGKMHNREASDG